MDKQDLIRILKRFRTVTDRRYQHKTDITLNTESKEIVGAINQLNDNKIGTKDIVDNLESEDNTKVLSAKQGKELKTQIDNNKTEVDNNLDKLNTKIDKNKQEVDSQINEKVNREEAGVITNIMLSQEVKEAMTGGSVAVVGKDTILTENIVDGEVTKDKINLTNNQKITSNLVIVGNTLINWDGTIANANAEPYNRHKMLKHYPVNKNQILKFKNNVEGAYDTAYKYIFYDENKNYISGSGVLIKDVANLTTTSSPVSYKDSYVIINMAEVLTKYPNAKYVCITFLKDEDVEIYDIAKSKIEWLDLNGNEEFEELKRKVDNPQKTYEKPFVIFSFDWYGRMYEKRYQIMKNEYGYNATFC